MFGADGADAIGKLFKLLDFDSVSMLEKGQKTVGVFDPKNIRSRFAKFDPAKRDSANILSSSGPPLGLLQAAQTAWDQFTGDRS